MNQIKLVPTSRNKNTCSGLAEQPQRLRTVTAIKDIVPSSPGRLSNLKNPQLASLGRLSCVKNATHPLKQKSMESKYRSS